KNDTEVCFDEVTALEHYVEICPHEKLYFPRLQTMVNLPGFKKSYVGINGLTRGISQHYSVIDQCDSYQCAIGNASKPSSCYGCGESKIFYARFYDPTAYSGPHPGALLESDWSFWLDPLCKEINTMDGVVQFHAGNPILLCPHKKLIDFVGPQRFLNAVHSYRHNTDPVVEYELKQLTKCKEECKNCHSSFELQLLDEYMSVKSIRLLGKADSPKDPIWLWHQADETNLYLGAAGPT
ncbi:MAG: hypothetical protein Q9226_007633, partial [Calogaya cf. arnoldii]